MISNRSLLNLVPFLYCTFSHGVTPDIPSSSERPIATEHPASARLIITLHTPRDQQPLLSVLPDPTTTLLSVPFSSLQPCCTVPTFGSIRAIKPSVRCCSAVQPLKLVRDGHLERIGPVFQSNHCKPHYGTGIGCKIHPLPRRTDQELACI